MVGRICESGRFLAFRGTLEEGKQMRVLTMKMRKQVKARERKSQKEVQEVDFKL